MRPKPYIGITGFTSRSQVEAIPRLSTEFGGHFCCMVGVLASSKTLRGRENKYPKRYPPRENMRDIFLHRYRCETAEFLNLVHLAVDSPEDILSDMLAAEMWGRCGGMQLNMKWPDPGIIAKFRELSDLSPAMSQMPPSVIVLQCGKGALADCGSNPQEIVRRIEEYGRLINYVLIDPSGGTGTEFDVDFAAACFRELQHVEHLGLGVAGGLNAGNVGKLQPLIDEFGLFSIDAEGRLRTEDDDLDMSKVRDYYKAAHKRFLG